MWFAQRETDAIDCTLQRKLFYQRLVFLHGLELGIPSSECFRRFH